MKSVDVRENTEGNKHQRVNSVSGIFILVPAQTHSA
mgnify:CR=1 FL=1